MPTPSTRTPVRIARGSYSNLNSSLSDLQDGEIVYAEDQDKLYVKEGSSLVVLTQPAASPTFTGTVTVPTPTAGDNSTVAASTAFVVASFATKASPTFTGTVTVPTAVSGDNSTKAASTAFVTTYFATLASPTLTGTPAAPTASAGTSTTQIATTAFVATSFAPLASPTLTGTPAAPTASANTNTTQIATTAFVMTELGDYATLAAPAFTGTATGVNLTLSGNLTVNGTTTTIDTTNLEVTDKNIIIGKVSTPTDTTADGGGITLKGATDKTWNWVDATNAWTSSEHIALPAGKRILLGTTTEGEADADDLTIATSANAGITIRSGTSNNGQIFFSDGTSGDDEYRGQLKYKHSDNSFIISTNATSALTLDSSQNATFAGTVSDSKGELRTIPQLSKSSAHTIVAGDAGQHSINSSGGWVINTSTGFTAGQAITLINNSGSDQTITSTGVTLYNSADGSTPSTLATRGMATVICTASNTYYISGAGLS
jgi:hypothetical protein